MCLETLPFRSILSNVMLGYKWPICVLATLPEAFTDMVLNWRATLVIANLKRCNSVKMSFLFRFY